MTLNIQQIYDYAKLATLAYVDLSASVSPNNPDEIIRIAKTADAPGNTARLPESLGIQMLKPSGAVSADITGQWTVLDPYFTANPATTGHSDPESGFAAMLVQNQTTGNKVLAIAGTEPGAPGQAFWDLAEADLHQIGFWGIALGQLVSLYNYVQVLRGTGNVDQLVLKIGTTQPANLQFFTQQSSDNGPTRYLWLETTTQADGRGLIAANEKIAVTGHSLGGHVAALAVALFPDLFTEAVTFNAPGYNPPTSSTGGLGADTLLSLFSQFGAQPASVSSVSGKITTFESEDASTGDDWEAVSGDVTGTPFSQEQYLTVERNTHDVGHMMDSLSISALLAQLDTSFDLANASTFIKAASSESLKSYEELLRALGHVVTGSPLEGVQDTGPTTGDVLLAGGGDFAARSTYYNALIGLANNPAFQSLAGKVTISLSSADLASGARDQFSSLLSLITLSPFVLKATAGNEAAVETALQTNWQTEYAAWQTDAERIALERAAGHGVPDDLNYSQRYLSERAHMLSYWIKHNLTDGQRNVDTSLPANRYYQDVATGASFIVDRTSNTSPDNTLKPKYLFGGESNDMLWGDDDHDVLFGGAGMDRLDGAKGNDYLEGNAGSDILTGGEGRDTLQGGSGNDSRHGDLGNDSERKTHAVNDGAFRPARRRMAA